MFGSIKVLLVLVFSLNPFFISVLASSENLDRRFIAPSPSIKAKLNSSMLFRVYSADIFESKDGYKDEVLGVKYPIGRITKADAPLVVVANDFFNRRDGWVYLTKAIATRRNIFFEGQRSTSVIFGMNVHASDFQPSLVHRSFPFILDANNNSGDNMPAWGDSKLKINILDGHKRLKLQDAGVSGDLKGFVGDDIRFPSFLESIKQQAKTEDSSKESSPRSINALSSPSANASCGGFYALLKLKVFTCDKVSGRDLAAIYTILILFGIFFIGAYFTNAYSNRFAGRKGNYIYGAGGIMLATGATIFVAVAFLIDYMDGYAFAFG